MRKLCMNRVFKFLTVLFLVSTLLSACGGADVPYTVSQPIETGTTPIPPTPPPHSSRCSIKLTGVQVSLRGKGAPGVAGEDAQDGPGMFSSGAATSFPDLPFSFNANEVKMKSADFPTGAQLRIGANALDVRMVSGQDGVGTYNPTDKSININNVKFEVSQNLLGPGFQPLPSMTFTTGSLEITGRNGPRSWEGRPIADDKTVEIVGGATLPNDFASASSAATLPQIAGLRGAALLVKFQGTFERMPDGQPCSDSDAGVRMVELTGEGDQQREVALSEANTLGIGNVYVPQIGTDVVSAGDERFSKTKKFRLKNGSDRPISGAFQNQQNFNFAPGGSFTLAPNENKDFTVTYSVAPVSDYSMQNVPQSRDVTVSSMVGGVNLSFKAKAKRASAELVVTGTEENARSSVDLGNMAVKVNGRGADTKLRCDDQVPNYYFPKKIIIENRGTRDLIISHISKPADAVQQNPDPGCIGGYGSEFVRLKLDATEGASCVAQVVNGHSYITDRCRISQGRGKISFKVVYFPINASSIVNAQNGNLQKDTATLDIENNDPSYASTHNKLVLNLSGSVSPDQSDVMSISKAKADGTDSDREIRQNGSTRINISNGSGEQSQVFFLRNRAAEPLNIRGIELEDSHHFEIETPAAAYQTVAAPDATGTPGKVRLGIKFRKLSDTRANSKITITFRVGSSTSDNTFSMFLAGSTNHETLTGHVQIVSKSINALVDSANVGAVDSDDTRHGLNQRIQPGPITFDFQAIEGQPTDSPFRKVVVLPALGATQHILPTNENLLSDIRSLPLLERRKLFRVYSTRFTRGNTRIDQRDNAQNVQCEDQDNINGPYIAGSCGYFYYILANKTGKTGFYDDDTGELILPDLDLKLVVPYHENVAGYTPDLLSVMDMKASITTLALDAYNLNNFPGSSETLSLVPDGLSFVIPSVYSDDTSRQILTEETRCPTATWTPKDFETTLPKVGCFISNSTRPFIKGFSFQEQDNGKYLGTIVLITRFAGEGATYGTPPKPQNVPFFLKDKTMWVAITGELQRAP